MGHGSGVKGEYSGGYGELKVEFYLYFPDLCIKLFHKNHVICVIDITVIQLEAYIWVFGRKAESLWS